MGRKKPKDVGGRRWRDRHGRDLLDCCQKPIAAANAERAGALVHPVSVARWPPLSKILDEGSVSNKQEIAISFSDFRIGSSRELDRISET